jgi:dihydrofolate reductase
MKLSAVVAASDNDVIGRDNALPWHLPADLAYFKRVTLGKPVLMGRRTALAIGRALPGRENLVLTRGTQAPYAGQQVVHSLDEACARAGMDLAVIGGGEVYALALPHATHLHLTWVDTVVEGADTFFPAFDESAWQVTSRELHPADARHAYAMAFVDYVRAE